MVTLEYVRMKFVRRGGFGELRRVRLGSGILRGWLIDEWLFWCGIREIGGVRGVSDI